MAVDVVLSRVNKLYGSNHVVKDVDLQFPALNFVTLLGPSGCGKTTLLRMIAGLETISGGDIHFGDRRVNLVRPGQRDVAMVFQNYALYPNMDVFRNIAYSMRVRRIPKAQIESKVREVASILEIDHLLDRKPRHLSGGQRQRVALGRAMVRKPAVFLMDEPLSNLDAKLRVNMRSELKLFHQRLQTTTVYVTHDQLEAMTMSDLIAVMHDGKVQQFGTPSQIYNEPKNLFVAGFIGSPPMNFLPAERTFEDRTKLRVGDASIDVPVGSFPGLDTRTGDSRLVLGVRPQDVMLEAGETTSMLRGVVKLVELLGSEKLVDIRLSGGERLVVQVRADHAVASGDNVSAHIATSAIQLFDETTGQTLRANAK